MENKIKEEMQEVVKTHCHNNKQCRGNCKVCAVEALYNAEYKKITKEDIEKLKKEKEDEIAINILKEFEYCNDTNFYQKWLQLCEKYNLEVN